MNAYPEDFKKTGHEDIDELLLENYYLLKEGEKLRKEIEDVLKFQLKKSKKFDWDSVRKLRR